MRQSRENKKGCCSVNQAIRKYATKRKGFSMLELVITIMIMTVLAGVMSPMFFQSKESANLAKADSEIGAIASALRMYYAQNGKFPASATIADATTTVLPLLADAGLIPSGTQRDPWGRAPANSADGAIDAGAASDANGYFITYLGANLNTGTITNPATGQVLDSYAILVGYGPGATATGGPSAGKVIAVVDTR